MRVRIAPPPDAEPEEEVQAPLLPLPQVAPAGAVPVSEASGTSLRARGAASVAPHAVLAVWPAWAMPVVVLPLSPARGVEGRAAAHCGSVF